jgi:hypothetical protein
MKRMKFLALILIVLASAAGLADRFRELANTNLQEDLRDMASQAGSHIGFIPPMSDEDASSAVVRKAKEPALS